MPRVKIAATQYAKSDFLREVRAKQAFYYGSTYKNDFAEILGTTPQTAARRLHDPYDLRLRELAVLVEKLNLDPAAVLPMIGYKPKEVKEVERSD